MSRDEKRNMAHSIFQRLLNQARTQGTDFNLLLSRYGMERFIYRLSISPYSESFILKGASLFLGDLLLRFGGPLIFLVGVGLVVLVGLWVWLLLKRPGGYHHNGYA